MLEITPLERNLLAKAYEKITAQVSSPEADRQLIQALLGLESAAVNARLVSLFDEETSPDSVAELEINPRLILSIFFDIEPDEYRKSSAFGFVGSVLGWMEQIIEEQ